MRRLTLILGVIGGILAVLGIWSFFLSWLNLLGIFVPPIGAVVITDQLLLGGIDRARCRDALPRLGLRRLGRRLPQRRCWCIGVSPGPARRSPA